MISITFAGLPIQCYQDSKLGYTIAKKETVLLTGDIHAAISTKKRSFPRTYQCWTDSYTNITNLSEQIGNFDTLTIAGISYTNCYISNLDSIFELSRGNGIWTYEIEFSQADTGSSVLAPVDNLSNSSTVTTLYTNYIYSDRVLAAASELHSLPLDITNSTGVNLYVSNTGDSENLKVYIKGSYGASGSILSPVFVCKLNTTVSESGAPLTYPPNYIFVDVYNDDPTNSATFSVILTRYVTN